MKGIDIMSVYFVPASFEDEDYRPSWTGNNSYPTVTIRGIFDTYEKALKAVHGWECEDTCEILERYCGDDDEIVEYFDIDYQDMELGVWKGDEHSCYKLNKIVNEDWSAVYDEEGALGVTDW